MFSEKGNPNLILDDANALLRKEIITELSGDAWILYSVYQATLVKYNDLPNDIAAADILGWHKSKAKRIRDNLTNHPNKYYSKVMMDHKFY